MNKNLKEQALKALENKWQFAILACFIALVCYQVIPKVFFFVIVGIDVINYFNMTISQGHMYIDLNELNEKLRDLYRGVFAFFCASLIAMQVWIGFNWLVLKLVRKDSVKVSDIFSGLRDTPVKLIIYTVLYIIYLSLWSLLLVVPGIIKLFSYSMAMFIMKDNPELSANQAITRSKEMMNGRKGELFRLVIGFAGWYILALIVIDVVGILFLYIAPVQNEALLITLAVIDAVIIAVFMVYFKTTLATYYESIVNPKTDNSKSHTGVTNANNDSNSIIM